MGVVLFGGIGDDVFGDTWLLGDSCWAEARAQGLQPEPRSAAGGAVDRLHGRLILYGGRSKSDAWLNDTWQWDGKTWAALEVATKPELRFPLEAYDSDLRQIVLFGLTSDLSQSQTWAWVGSNWQQLHVDSSPTPRFSTSFAYDEVSKSVILFGGRAGSSIYLGDTWAFNGTTWRELEPSSSPSARQNHLIVSVTGGLILAGGDTRGRLLTDTWFWNGSTWSEVHTEHSVPTWGAAGIASRDGNAIVLGYSSADAPGETLQLLNGDWTPLVAATTS